ncbi:hypothetical protein LIER_24006 [Lithospermum erythrorhizon]|uniref:Uncharacterized protein n=1 Tax=Lithospermum erythrorhizon TaxID=34254 RepID=A0AAV3R3A7_LITER
MEVDAQIVNQEAQKAKGQKSTIKGKRLKAPVSSSMEDDQVLSPTPIRSLHPFNSTYGVIHGEIPDVHNNYLSLIDYIHVRELNNPRPSRINRDDDVGGERSNDEIRVEEDVIGEVVTRIFEEGVNDSSCAEMLDAANVSDPPDTTGKTAEPSIVSEKSAGEISKDVPKGDGEDVSHVDTMTEGVEVPSTKGLGVDVNPSVEDTLDWLKDSTLSRGDVMKSFVDDSIKDIVDEGMHADLPSVFDTKPVIVKATGEGVIPSVTNTVVETAGSMERPTVSQGIDDTLNADI